MGLFSKSDGGKASQSEGLLARLSGKMSAATESFSRSLGDLLLGQRALDASLMEELETLLLQADVGVDATAAIVAEITERSDRGQLANAAAAYEALRRFLIDMLTPNAQPLRIAAQPKPFIVMVVGINGAGKTTTIGKLAQRLQQSGHKVMLAAGDTFRAAAVEQLQAWASRTNAALVMQPQGADAAAVAHDAVKAAAARAYDVLLIDTAGRLHTQGGLMDELKKIRRVIAKAAPDAPHEVLLVLDGSIGQNAVIQTQQFQQAVGVTGLCLTKLDGTAKGGVLFALAKKTGLPIRFIGVGEAPEDLREFNASEFVDALLPRR